MAREVRKHVLIISFPVDDHFIPTLEFARRVSDYHDVTFAMSKGKLEPLLKQHEQFQTVYGDVLFVCIDDDLSAKDFTINNIINQRINAGTERFLRLVLQNISAAQSKTEWSNGINPWIKRVNVVIVDILLTGSALLCHQFNVPYYLFNPISSTLKLKLLAADQQNQNVNDFKSNSVIYINSLLEDDKDFKEKMFFAEGVIINSIRELEMPSLYSIPLKAPRMATMRMSCVGPLLPKEEFCTSHDSGTLSWLNYQENNQVTFVSLGSTTDLNFEQIREMGKALLQLGNPFIWSLPVRHQQYLPDEMKKIMVDSKDKAQEKTQRFVVVPSASRKLVLEHPSTAVFVTNCDWIGVFQSLAAGKPLIAWWV